VVDAEVLAALAALFSAANPDGVFTAALEFVFAGVFKFWHACVFGNRWAGQN
jgi:hypothetical protein